MSTENASLSCSIDVVGSLNIDLVTVTPRVPSRGETLTATSFSTGFGGKGANQAVACARLLRLAPQAQPEHGVTVRMLGATGDDQFGVDFRNHLEREGVDIAALKTKDALSTGTAVILVEQDSGDNRILFTPGANGAVSTEDIHLDGKAGDFVIFQLEIPLPVVSHALPSTKMCDALPIVHIMWRNFADVPVGCRNCPESEAAKEYCGIQSCTSSTSS